MCLPTAGLLRALRCFNSTQYTILRALVRYHPPGIVEPCRMSLERYHLILCSMYAPSELNEQFGINTWYLALVAAQHCSHWLLACG